ncbi:MAG TPA: hypothetical protein VF165_22645, partial [Nocardioidaceae bacterium]
DWGVSVNSTRDRASVQALMRWLLKRDAFGNRYAMARRLGIQYMIWNRRIWGSYAAGSGWRKYTGSNPHTDHVHFSLSWAGARKKTSFWSPRNFPNSSGNAPTPPRTTKPKPAPEPTTPPSDRHDYPQPNPDGGRKSRSFPEPRSPRTLAQAAPVVAERLSVPTSRRAGARTHKALVAGHRYLIEVSGTYRYQRKAGAVADAECSTRPGASWWQRERSLRDDQWYADHLDLYVDGHDLLSESDDGQNCDTGHSYRWVYEAPRTGRVPFAVWDPTSYKDNRGKLNVRVLDLGAVRDSMTWNVPAKNTAGATSPGLLQGGRDYLVTVSGTWRNGEGVTADAECAKSWGDSWRRDVDSYDMVAGDWSYDSLVPQISGVRTMPVSGGSDCDPEHTYTWVQHADRTSPLNVRVSDPDRHGDNSGALRVTVKPYDGSSTTPDPTPDPTPLPVPDLEPEHLQVDSRSATSVRTEQEYPAGTDLRVTATGTYFMRAEDNWVAADAECTATAYDHYWRSTRFDGLWGGKTSPLGDLAVNGQIITWQSGGGSSCDWEDHSYTYDLTTTEDGPLRFVVADDTYGNNRGALEVQVDLR